MNLKKLTGNNYIQIKDKSIYCYEKSESYLKELCTRFDLIDFIHGIFDNNKRNQGQFVFAGRELQVKDIFEMEDVDWTRSIIIITSDYFNEAYDILSKFLKKKGYNGDIYYFANKETEYDFSYREQYQDCELEDIIIFRSGPHASSYVKGMDFSDNTRALFEYMLVKDYNSKYKLIWLVKNPDDFANYANIPNVEFLSFNWSVSENRQERDRYYQALCLAKYIFFTDAYGFARNCRKDQIRVQLWHGCGFKTRVNFIRCEKRYEYTTVISDLYSKIHQEIYGLREDQMLVTGYAKEDWLFSPVTDFTEVLSLPKAMKYIFWLPTFRMAKKELAALNEYELDNQTGIPIIDTFDKCRILDKLLQEKKIVLVIKLHPFQDRSKISAVNCTNIVLLDNDELFQRDIQINRLLGCADALISDYSSAAVDYMVLDRPIAFTLDDVDEYESSRGFVFENIRDWLPGKKIYTFEDFCQFMKEIYKGEDSTRAVRRNLMQKMHKYGDNRNCERIIGALGI